MAKFSTTKIKQDFSKRLNQAINWKYPDASYRELAKILGVSTTFISDMRNGNKMAASDSGVQLAEKLGVSYNWLMAGQGPMVASKEVVSIAHLSPKAQNAVRVLVASLESENG